MLSLETLTNTQDPFLPHFNEWVTKAKNKLEVLSCDAHRAAETLMRLQVTTRSAMGAVTYHTGGILVDEGWIRILGSGSEALNRSIPEWNKGKTFTQYGEIPPYMLIADDAIGGFFAINGGFFGKDEGNIYYFAPDSLEWIPMAIGYPNFLLFCFDSDLNQFYDGLRWQGWQHDIKKLKADYAYSFYPSLWTKEASDINKVARKVLAVEEIYNINMTTKVDRE